MNNLTKKQKIIIGAVIGLVFLSLIGWLVYKNYKTTSIESPKIVEEKVKEPDSNGDGLPDSQAMSLGLNPRRTDTDGDGIFDVDEINITKTNPTNVDSDGDGMNDLEELRAGRNPNQAD